MKSRSLRKALRHSRAPLTILISKSEEMRERSRKITSNLKQPLHGIKKISSQADEDCQCQTTGKGVPAEMRTCSAGDLASHHHSVKNGDHHKTDLNKTGRATKTKNTLKGSKAANNTRVGSKNPSNNIINTTNKNRTSNQ